MTTPPTPQSLERELDGGWNSMAGGTTHQHTDFMARDRNVVSPVSVIYPAIPQVQPASNPLSPGGFTSDEEGTPGAAESSPNQDSPQQLASTEASSLLHGQGEVVPVKKAPPATSHTGKNNNNGIDEVAQEAPPSREEESTAPVIGVSGTLVDADPGADDGALLDHDVARGYEKLKSTYATNPSTAPAFSQEGGDGTQDRHYIPTPALVDWKDQCIQKNQLDKLVKVLDNAKVQHYLGRCAKDANDKSATPINQATQIFLSNGKDRTYTNMNERYKKKSDRTKTEPLVKPDVLVNWISSRVKSKFPKFEHYTVANPSILSAGNRKRGPQPIHSDLKHRVVDDSEYFGIVSLSKDTKGTIYYDLEGIPRSPTVDDLTLIWPDAPKPLWDKLREEKNQSARQLIADYGTLLFTPPNLRMGGEVVDQYSISIFQGSHPHCAPACDKPRHVLFFTLQPPKLKGSAYAGDEQMSKEKLTFRLYEELLPEVASLKEDGLYLLKKFAQFVVDSAKLGARDETFDFGEDGKWKNWHNKIIKYAEREAKAKEEAKRHEEMAERAIAKALKSKNTPAKAAERAIAKAQKSKNKAAKAEENTATLVGGYAWSIITEDIFSSY